MPFQQPPGCPTAQFLLAAEHCSPWQDTSGFSLQSATQTDLIANAPCASSAAPESAQRPARTSGAILEKSAAKPGLTAASLLSACDGMGRNAPRNRIVNPAASLRITLTSFLVVSAIAEH